MITSLAAAPREMLSRPVYSTPSGSTPLTTGLIALVGACPSPLVAVGARSLRRGSQRGGVGRVEGDRDQPEAEVAEVNLPGDPVPDFSHRREHGAALVSAVDRSEVVEREGAAPVVGGQRLPGLIDEGEPRREPDSGQNLDRLEDSEQHDRDQDQAG